MKNEQVEVIKCLCGSTVAASVVKYIDGEWIANKKNYISKGYTSEILENSDFSFAKCKCGEVKTDPAQLELF